MYRFQGQNYSHNGLQKRKLHPEGSMRTRMPLDDDYL